MPQLIGIDDPIFRGGSQPGFAEVGTQPNFPGTSVAQPMPEPPKPMTPGPGVIGAEVSVTGSAPAIATTNDVAYYEDMRTGDQIPRGSISDFTSGRGPYKGKVSMKEEYQGAPRIQARYDKTLHAEQALGGYADRGDILQPSSETTTIRAEDAPGNNHLGTTAAQNFIAEHGSAQQGEYAKATPAERKDFRKNPGKLDNMVKDKFRP